MLGQHIGKMIAHRKFAEHFERGNFCNDCGWRLSIHCFTDHNEVNKEQT